MSVTGYSREQTRADFEAEQRVRLDDAARNDRLHDAIARRTTEPDPHVILFDDGCASWLTCESRADADRELVRLLDEGPPLWAGASVVPKRRVWTDTPNGRVYTDFHGVTGERLLSYRDCPRHNEDARARAAGVAR